MSFLLDQLSEQFDPDVRARGTQYQRRGSVRILSADASGIRAKVYGTQVYDVSARVRSVEDVEFQCNCPYYDQELGPCKHVWATLLQADRNSQLVEDDDDFNPMQIGFGSAPTQVNQKKVAPTDAGPRWKKIITNARQDARSTPQADFGWPPNTRLAYVLDLSEIVSENDIYVELATQKQLGAKWDRPKQGRFRPGQLESVPTPEDRLIIQMLRGAKDEFGGDRYESMRRFCLDDTCFDTTLKSIVETGRCFVRDSSGNPAPEPVKWDMSEPFKFQLKLNGDDAERNYRLEGWLVRGDHRIALTDPSLLVPGGLMLMNNSFLKFEHGGAWPMLTQLREESKEVVVSRQDGIELVKELSRLPMLPPIEWPKDLELKYADVEPKPILRLRRPKTTGNPVNDRLLGELIFDYSGNHVPAQTDRAVLFREEDRTMVNRMLPFEMNCIRKLGELGFRSDYDSATRTNIPSILAQKLPAVVHALVGEGWQIEAEGKLYRKAGKMKVEVSSGIDWFELTAEMDFEGMNVSMPKLLAALRRGENMVMLDDGSMGLLPEEWLKKYAPLAGVAEEVGEALRFTNSQAAFLDLLVSQLPDVTIDETFARARKELTRFDGVAPQEPPATFKGELRPYQKEGLGWLQFLQKFSLGGCLADDMGLGKTIQVLSMLESRRLAKSGPSLVVVPRSLVFNWLQEAAKFTPELRVLDQSQPDRARQFEHFKDYDLIITTYGTLRQDINYFKDFKFDYAILDESQAIKNSSTASAKASRLLRSNFRLAMSGTPIENHLGELWSLLEFLNPGMLGSSNVFMELAGNSHPSDVQGRQLLAQALRPFILRRSKSQVARDLPDKTEQTIYCELEPAQRKMYDELKEHYRQNLLGMIESQGMGKAKIQILEALLRLRQAACHPGLIDSARKGDPSAKIDTLVDQVQEVMDEGHKVLVFSQFTSLLAILMERLDEQKVTYEYLDGKTRNRQEKVERFQNDPECRLFLISLKAGGTGLNLTAADYVFLLDPWWNPAVEAQAIDRAHRIGQTRAVIAYRLIAKDTVEEKVLQLQKNKRELAEAILTADNSLIGGLKREDLEMLLS